MKRFKIIVVLYLLFGISVITTGQITPWEAASRMKKGINLGNTMEPPTEAGWNNPKAQEYYFDLYKDAGFSCVRIPVRWDNYTAQAFPYKVNTAWLDRVEQVVDWGLSRGLFIVINSHHDNWIKENYSNAAYRERFDSIWSQIATRFKDKSERLIFEVLNEPTTEVKGLTIAENNEMHARIISIIRKTNPTRIIIFQGHNWGGSDELLQAAIPNDRFVMGSFHSYDPYQFGLKGEGTWGSDADINTLRNKFISVKNWSDKNNIPVFLGEFGSVRSCDYNSRMKHYKYYIQFAREYGFVSCAWDDGGDFKILERQGRYWDEIKDILIYSSPKSPENLKLGIFQDSILKLTWVNKVTDNDSIYIERRKSTETNYKKIAAINKNLTEYLDVKPDTNFTYHYRVIACYKDSAGIYSYPQRMFFPGYTIRKRELFLETPASIPGIIEAENFDNGGEGIAYHDSDSKNDGDGYRINEAVDIFDATGKYLVFNASPGEWYEYTVDVKQERTYNVNIDVATPTEGGKFILKIGNVESDTIFVTSSGSWVNTTTVKTSIKPRAGIQVMRLSILGYPAFNIDNMKFEVNTGTSLILNGNGNFFNVIQPYNSNKLIVKVGNQITVNCVNLYDITGSLIRSVYKPEPTTEIVLNTTISGVYIIQVVANEGRFAKKVVVR